jgi:hypothetical protein
MTGLFRALLVTSLVATAQASADTDADKVDREYLELIRHFCAWAPTHTPFKNPVRIEACEARADPDATEAMRHQSDWWTWARNNHPEEWLAVARAWDAEIEAVKLREERARQAAEKRQREKAAEAVRQKRLALIPSMNTTQLCIEYRQHETQAAFDRLVELKAFPAADLPMIAGRRLAIGMTEDSMRCVLGTASDINRSVGSWGVHIQYVYRNLGVNVYTENGRVSAWQD